MTTKTQNNLGVLLRSYEALYNWRALSMLAGSFVLGGLIISAGVAAAQTMPLMVGLTTLFGGILIIVGVSASGLMLIDQAYDQPIRDFSTAFFGGIRSTLYIIGLFILLGLGFAVVVLAAYLLSLLGRIPSIGGLFDFLLAGPLTAVVALAYVVLVLSGPLMIVTVWHGEGFIDALSHVVSIVIKRPLEVFLHFLVLGLVVSPAVAFMYGAVFFGSMIVGSFFASGAFGTIMGAIGNLSSFAGHGGMNSYGGYGGMGGYGNAIENAANGFAAASISINLVWFLASSLACLIFVLGTIFVYRSVSEGMDPETSEAVGQKLEQFKQKLKS